MLVTFATNFFDDDDFFAVSEASEERFHAEELFEAEYERARARYL